ncbi:MAG TPA: sarcosine oxidase subunit gamma family protein [Steroidobacteraceae bacterium]
MTDYMLSSRAAFTGLTSSSGVNRGVVVFDRDALAIATLLTRKNQAPALAQRVRARFGLELPNGPRRVARDDIALLQTAPEAWLVTREEGGDGFAAFVSDALGDVAAVADQSSAYAILRVTGPAVRATLAKILPIDLHEHVLGINKVASTMASHVAATLWRLEDAADGSSVFEIAVFRSFAASFWHSLDSSAAEFGLVVHATVRR